MCSCRNWRPRHELQPSSADAGPARGAGAVAMKPSERLQRVPPYAFAELERKIAAKRAAGAEVISLGIGDPDRPTPPLIVEAMLFPKICYPVRPSGAPNQRSKYSTPADARPRSPSLWLFCCAYALVAVAGKEVIARSQWFAALWFVCPEGQCQWRRVSSRDPRLKPEAW